jgi:hypothetical protein
MTFFANPASRMRRAANSKFTSSHERRKIDILPSSALPNRRKDRTKKSVARTRAPSSLRGHSPIDSRLATCNLDAFGLPTLAFQRRTPDQLMGEMAKYHAKISSDGQACLPCTMSIPVIARGISSQMDGYMFADSNSAGSQYLGWQD